jgi:23S rRNA pseudouridine2605 synthase
MKERIQKALASLGLDSRRHIEDMVLAGRVAVNGKLVRKLPVMVDVDEDTIEIDGVEISSPRKAKRLKNRDRGPVYILMNKPKGVYSTNVAQGEQQRAIDLLPPGFETRVYPVGRLDAESTGLLLLTNDGELTNKLTHPRYGVSKTYRCYCDGFIGAETIARMTAGIWLADPEKGGFKASASKVEVVKRLREKTVLDITLNEGRNRQVRRMLAALGHKVRNLSRIKMGPLILGNLKPGQSRMLKPSEVKQLHSSVEKSAARAEAKRTERVEKKKLAPAKPKPAFTPKKIKPVRESFDDQPSRPAKHVSHPLGFTKSIDDDDLPNG